MGFSWQEYWSGLPFPSPGDLPNPGIEPTSLMCPTFEGRFFTTSTAWGVAYQAIICLRFWLPTLDMSDYFMVLLALFTFMQWRRKWQPTPVFLPGKSQGWGSLVGYHLWGRTESDMTEVT